MPSSATLVNNQTITATGNSAGQYVGDLPGPNLQLQVNVSAIGGTTPSYTFTPQWSWDNVNFGPVDGGGDAFAAITANGTTVKSVPLRAPYVRLAYTVSGTTPTAAVTALAGGVLQP